MEAEQGEIAALVLEHESDRRAVGDVEHAAFDQVLVHGRVEERVVDDVVDVSVRIVVAPARRDRREAGIERAAGGDLAFGHRGFS